jgi:hypothetical protein
MWIKAIALAKKINGSKAYLLVENDGEGTIIKRDFGEPAQIVQILELYPYESLDNKYIPHFDTDAANIEYLFKFKNDEEMQEIRRLFSTVGKTYNEIYEDRRKVRRITLACASRQARQTLADDLKYRKAIEKNNKSYGEKEQTNSSKNTAGKAKRGRKSSADKLQG